MLPQYNMDPLNESESLIDRSLMPGKLQAIYSQRVIDELPDNASNGSTSDEGSAESFAIDENDEDEDGDGYDDDDDDKDQLIVLNKNIDPNNDEMNILIKKLENKEIKISNEFDNEIVLQLIDFIKTQRKDMEINAKKFYNLEIDKTELETNYYQLKIHLTQLQSENEIQRDIVNEQKIDLEDQLLTITKVKSVELGQIQNSINNEAKVLHSYIYIYNYIFTFFYLFY